MAQIDDWVAALHASLGRAADIFLNPVKEPDGTKTKVYFQLKETLTPELKKCTRSFISAHAKEGGFKVSGVKFYPRYMHFTAEVRPEGKRGDGQRSGRRTSLRPEHARSPEPETTKS